MSNLALQLLLPMMMVAYMPHLFSSNTITIAGAMTISVIVLWPTLASRIKDPELTLRKMGCSLFGAVPTTS